MHGLNLGVRYLGRTARRMIGRASRRVLRAGMSHPCQVRPRRHGALYHKRTARCVHPSLALRGSQAAVGPRPIIVVACGVGPGLTAGWRSCCGLFGRGCERACAMPVRSGMPPCLVHHVQSAPSAWSGTASPSCSCVSAGRPACVLRDSRDRRCLLALASLALVSDAPVLPRPPLTGRMLASHLRLFGTVHPRATSPTRRVRPGSPVRSIPAVHAWVRCS
jgi:hypothetical protein